MEKSFEVEALQVNNADGIKYEIKDFENVKAIAKSICDSFEVKEIINDEQNKDAKDFRAKCNKAKKQIADLRISTTKEIMTTFEEQAKQLEKMFDDKKKAIGVVVNAYADSKKEEKTLVKTKTIKKSLKITFDYSDKLLQKITEFCEKNNIELEEI